MIFKYELEPSSLNSLEHKFAILANQIAILERKSLIIKLMNQGATSEQIEEAIKNWEILQ